MSTALVPRKIPVRPPVTNSETTPNANRDADVNWIRALAIVNSQLKAFTAEGMAIARVVTTKTLPRNGLIPLTNMWCPQTRKLRVPIAMIA